MQADLLMEDQDPDYNEKVAKCCEMRAHRLTSKQDRENKKWEQSLNSEKNYIMYKKGYKHMLDDIGEAKVNLSKYKRGLSIFED